MYFSKYPLYYSEGKCLIICCWNLCKKEHLPTFLKSFGDICHGNFTSKMNNAMGSVFIPWSCWTGVWLCVKTKKWRQSAWERPSMAFLRLCYHGWGSERSNWCIGLFDCIIFRSGTEHLLMPSISGQAVPVPLPLSNTDLLRHCLWNWLFLQCNLPVTYWRK